MSGRNEAMQHLDPERLAAFDQEAPLPDELAHLAVCAVCRRERAAFERLADLVAAEATTDAGPRLTEWSMLSAELRREGLLTRPSGEHETADRQESLSPPDVEPAAVSMARPGVVRRTARSPRRMRRLVPAWLRAAAAVALVAGGMAAGRLSVAGSGLGERPATALTPAGAQDEFTSVAEASGVLERAQRDFERASLWLAAHDTTVNAQAVYRARLAALDQMMMASRAGLYEAPQDPVLNQYYLAAYTAREATLRQLGASLSVDRVMERF